MRDELVLYPSLHLLNSLLPSAVLEIQNTKFSVALCVSDFQCCLENPKARTEIRAEIQTMCD